MSEQEDVLRTLAAPVVAELEKRSGSRFVAHLLPAPDASTAMALIDELRQESPDASHHCWAYVLQDGTARSSDDGEPRDTAGAPILRHLLGAELVGVVAIVVRWYGGTNLGRGGLIRAYGDATSAALASADVTERVAKTPVRLRYAYDDTSSVERVAAAFDAAEVDSSFGADVQRTYVVPRAATTAFIAAMSEATAGRVTPEDDADVAATDEPAGS